MAGGLRSFLAFWLGGGNTPVVVPSVITNIKSGQLKMRAGTLALKNESGALSLRTFGPSLHLVITS